MKNYIKTVVALSLICAVIAVLLAVGNAVTAPIIKEKENEAVNQSLKVVMPEGEDFEQLDFADFDALLPASITEIYKEVSGGYVFKLSTAGYASNFIIMCGVGNDGKVTGTTCISSAETLGYEHTYGENLVGTDIATIDSVDTIAGATKTTGAYKDAIKNALEAFKMLSSDGAEGEGA